MDGPMMDGPMSLERPGFRSSLRSLQSHCGIYKNCRVGRSYRAGLPLRDMMLAPRSPSARATCVLQTNSTRPSDNGMANS